MSFDSHNNTQIVELDQKTYLKNRIVELNNRINSNTNRDRDEILIERHRIYQNQYLNDYYPISNINSYNNHNIEHNEDPDRFYTVSFSFRPHCVIEIIIAIASIKVIQYFFR